ncbi:sensor histidine kinase [Levilactobacillus sp. N40-8-2]|uniref:sensor histidine kinase n=1 Tax=Levilactobacillus muriae TaxID=3238987 RepID=UPI0038B3B6F1
MLGRQNFTIPESAILELVKNSYDCGARKCTIIFSAGLIKISDDGSGMSMDDIETRWMHVGNGRKKYIENNRILSGSKGVGRFALARLGNKITMTTRKGDDGNPIIWKTNWQENVYGDSSDVSMKSGTTLEIRELRDGWRIETQRKLIDYLNRMYNDSEMQVEIVLKTGDTLRHVDLFSDESILKDSRYVIQIQYDSSTRVVDVDVSEHEFEKNVGQKVSGVKLGGTHEDISLIDDKNINDESDPGNFSATLFFNMSSTRNEIEKWFYLRNNILKENYKNVGVILYRNAFSINGFEGMSDWLKIDERVRKSPAVATHPTGKWRVRGNQLAGLVRIDKQTNFKIRDLSNRQGVEDNEALANLRNIVYTGLEVFEKYRQYNIRLIRKYRDAQEEELIQEESKERGQQKNKLIKDFVANPGVIQGFSEDETRLTVEGIVDLQNINAAQRERIKSIQADYKYEVRVLSSLATQGLHASREAHNLKTDRQSLLTSVGDIEERLKELKLWDTLEKNKGKYLYKDVPGTLDKLEKGNNRLSRFVETLLSQSEKKNFLAVDIDLSVEIERIFKKWHSEFGWINFSLNNNFQNMKEKVRIPRDVLETILDNLIMNSEEQNREKGILNVSIELLDVDENIKIRYKDDGIGLSEKYKGKSMDILNVQETTREDGHGLGMWIVNDLLVSVLGGEVDFIGEPSKNGFEIMFTLKEMVE